MPAFGDRNEPSEERRLELPSRLRPPRAAAIEPFHAADLSPHLHESGLARLGMASDNSLTN